MAIIYPLDQPTNVIPTTMDVAEETSAAVTFSPHTLKPRAHLNMGFRFGYEVTLPRMNREEAEIWIAWRRKLKGPFGTTFFGSPYGDKPRGFGDGGGTPMVDGADQTGDTIVTDGWPNNQTVLRVGDYFDYGSGADRKLHAALDDVVSNGSGQATFDIWPPLLVAPADDTVLNLIDTKGVFLVPDRFSRWTMRTIVFSNFTFPLVQVP